MQAGTVLNEKYRLASVLGRGGMGSVWRAEHLGLRAPVAVKLMDPALALTPDALARFHREAHAAATIRSPHVVQVLDHGVDEPSNTPFIVMELLDGETLGERLAREGSLSPARTAELIADVCRALTRAHQAGIVHRDLKPENIFLVKDEREFAKVLDFGVAKSQPFALGISRGTSSGSLVGTPRYMSPEHINGSKQLDGRSDLWSVAVIACECITGRCPFDEESLGTLLLAICTQPAPPASFLGRVTPAFEAWLSRALERDPALRFQSARALSEALARACAEGEAGCLEGRGGSSEAPSAEVPAPASYPPAPALQPQASAVRGGGAGDTLVLPSRRGRSRFAFWNGPAFRNGSAFRNGPAARIVAASSALLIGFGAWLVLGQDSGGPSAPVARPAPSRALAPAPVSSPVNVTSALVSEPPDIGQASSPKRLQVDADKPARLPSADNAPPRSPAPTRASAHPKAPRSPAPARAARPTAPPSLAPARVVAPPPPRKRPSRQPALQRPAPRTTLQSALEGARGRQRK